MIKEALQHYNFSEPNFIFIRHNENMTYEIRDGEGVYLLRIHKAAEGLNFSFQCGETPRQVFVKSEVELLLKLLSDTDIEVQHPIKNKYDKYITELQSGDYATVLSWIDGDDLSNIPMTHKVVYEIGRLIGRLHNQMFDLPHINRYCYDEFMIERLLHEIEKAYKLGHMSERHYQCIYLYLLKFTKLLQKERQKFILIHADLSKSNLIYHEKQIIPIDFSLSGYALPEMDLADMCCSLNDKTLTIYLINGYKSVSKYCPNDLYIDVYFAFSIVLYIAYHHERFYMDEKSQKSLDRWTDTIIEPICNKME
jgi:Ser/Thr protein kinase RdoA (MazF antagonist)